MPAGTFKMYAGGEVFWNSLRESLELESDPAVPIARLNTPMASHDDIEAEWFIPSLAGQLFDCSWDHERATAFWGWCPEPSPPVTTESIAAAVEKMRRILR